MAFEKKTVIITDEDQLLTLRLLEAHVPYNGRKGKREGKFFNRFSVNGIVFSIPEIGNERFTQAVVAKDVTKLIVETDQAPVEGGKAGEMKDAYNFLGFKDETMEDTKLFRTVRRKKISAGDFGTTNIFADLMQLETASVESTTELTTD